MSRLVSFLSALWLFSAVHFGSAQVNTDAENGATNELQGLDAFSQSLAFIGGSFCSTVKPILGVSYNDFEDNEPDMSTLTLVYIARNKTLTYNLTDAPTALPKEDWFDPECRMLVYLHGFTDNPQKSSFLTLRLAVEAGLGTCVNILALDAGSLLKCFYLRATTIVTFIGRVLGEAFAALILAGLNPSKIHLIGHSLGAHIAGFAGKEVSKRLGRNIGRITALDPAGPCFSAVEPTLGLFKTDADFVDVMHTDAGVYGMGQTMGHVDFWVNGGSQQPGCPLQTCSHGRALEYFAESMVFPVAFIGVKCNSYYDFRQGRCDISDMSFMGYYTPANITGDYYLISSGQSPFGTGALGTTYAPNDFVRGITFAIRDAFLNLWRRITNRSN